MMQELSGTEINMEVVYLSMLKQVPAVKKIKNLKLSDMNLFVQNWHSLRKSGSVLAYIDLQHLETCHLFF